MKLENGLVDITGATTIEDQMEANWKKMTRSTTFMRIIRPLPLAPMLSFSRLSPWPKTLKSKSMRTPKIIVTAYAVQADGFDTVEEAWNATFGAPTTGN